MATGSFLHYMYEHSMPYHSLWLPKKPRPWDVSKAVRGESTSTFWTLDTRVEEGATAPSTEAQPDFTHKQSVTMHPDAMNLQTFDSKRSGSKRLLNFLDGEAEVDSWSAESDDHAYSWIKGWRSFESTGRATFAKSVPDVWRFEVSSMLGWAPF